MYERFVDKRLLIIKKHPKSLPFYDFIGMLESVI